MIHEMQLRQISSRLTVFNKFILPGIFALGMFNVLFFGGSMELAADVWWVYLIPFAFEAFILWHSWGAKWVAIDETNGRLYVSNYRREIAIPLSHIVDVTESIWSDPRRVKITLGQPSEFGNKIIFYATYRFGGIFSGPHPIVNELLTLVAKE